MPIEAAPRYQNDLSDDIWLNIIRVPYKEITAYFIRSHKGVLLFVNSTLSIQEQAQAINTIKKEIAKCPVSNMGLINNNWIYKCNGICCK